MECLRSCISSVYALNHDHILYNADIMEQGNEIKCYGKPDVFNAGCLQILQLGMHWYDMYICPTTA